VNRLISSVDVSKLLGWSVQRARRWLMREGLGIRIGSRWYTTRTRLRDTFPDLAEDLTLELSEDADG
jgi:hypothetical protein